jgi:NAD(P)-dependent dehydrogenase (short-subunit alcohol dehydrogenase family)
MSTNINKERERTVALLTGGSRRIGAAICRMVGGGWSADVASAFVTNGVQQVLRLSKLSPKQYQNGENN